MSDLIARLEAATGPDRELDRAIAKALGVMPLYQMRGQIGSSWPDFTDSIDAALTLVPEGWRWHSYYWPRKDEPKIMSLVTSEPHVGIAHGKAATPALAICIAALKARGEL